MMGGQMEWFLMRKLIAALSASVIAVADVALAQLPQAEPAFEGTILADQEPRFLDQNLRSLIGEVISLLPRQSSLFR
jgi:hypothetical protein